MNRCVHTVVALVIAIALSGCVTSLHKTQDVRSTLTNLQTGEVVELVMGKTQSNRSKVMQTSAIASGESFTGEFTTAGRSNVGTGVSAGYYSGGGWSIGLDLIRWLGSNQRGSAILKGDQGTVIDITYVATHGGIQGEGRDNNGVRYRFNCCDADN